MARSGRGLNVGLGRRPGSSAWVVHRVQVRRGVIELCILWTLAVRERYGYELVEELSEVPVVTPVRVEVALETQAQYAAAGLKLVDPLTRPQVAPEPRTWLLMALGLVLLVWSRCRWT